MASQDITSFLKDQDQFAAHLQWDVSLFNKTSFQCSANAHVVFKPTAQNELALFLQVLFQNGFVYCKDFHVLGKGSNLLFLDQGYTGCLIDLSCLNQVQTLSKNEHWVLNVQAGVGMGTLLQKLRKEAFTGFEFVFGIPGSIGGGIRMNAGTPQGWFSQVLQKVYGFDAKGEFFDIPVDEKDFEYRNFPFGQDKIITGGVFTFAQSQTAVVEEKIKFAKAKRSNQPLQFPNFGSVFKNPKPFFAGQLIEEVGLRGLQIGQVQISTMHANFMINHGHAKTKDVLALIEKAKQEVLKQKDILLETEVHILGEEF